MEKYNDENRKAKERAKRHLKQCLKKKAQKERKKKIPVAILRSATKSLIL